MILQALVVVGLVAIAQAQDPVVPEKKKAVGTSSSYGGVQIDLFHKSAYDVDRKELDVIASGLGIDWDVTGRGFDRFFRDPSADVYGLKVRFSSVPLLLKDSVKDDLDATLEYKVDRALAANPQFQAYPPGTQAVVRQQTLDGFKGKQHERLDQVELETTFQQVAFSWGHGINEGAFLWMDVGKMPIHAGAVTDFNGLTDAETYRASSNPIQRALNSMSTGAFHANVGAVLAGQEIQVLGKPRTPTIGADLWLFSERAPFISGRHYLGTIAQLSDADYDDHEKYWNINSGVVRLSADLEVLSGYLSGGVYDGDAAVGAGAAVNLSRDEDYHKTWSFGVDGVYSDRAISTQSGMSLQANRFLLEDDLVVTGGIDLANNYYVPTNDREIDYAQARVGAAWSCPLGVGRKSNLVISGECKFGDLDTDSRKNIGGVVSFYFDIRW